MILVPSPFAAVGTCQYTFCHDRYRMAGHPNFMCLHLRLSEPATAAAFVLQVYWSLPCMVRRELPDRRNATSGLGFARRA